MYNILSTEPGNIPDILSVLKSVATANGKVAIHDIQEKTLNAIARHLFRSETDIDSLDSSFNASADQIPEELRKEVIHIATVLTILEDKDRITRTKTLGQLAAYWEIEKSYIKTIDDLAHDHKTRMFLHELKAGTQEIGVSLLGQIWGLTKSKLHLDGNKETLARFESYRLLPENTFGHTMTRYYEENEFVLPGTPGDFFSNVLIRHDYHHVLSGCSTSPLGEMCVFAFDAGISGVDYTTTLVALIVQFQLGVVMDTSIPAWIDQFDPDSVFYAYESGLKCNTNYIDDMDFDFTSLMTEPLSDIRKRFNIPEEGILVPNKEKEWCGPLGAPYKRQSDKIVKSNTLNL